MEVVRASGQVAGPGLGGALVTLLGAANVVLVQAVVFAVSAATLLGIRARETPVDRGADAGRLRTQVAEGVRFVVRDRVLRATAIGSAASTLSFAIASAVTIVRSARIIWASLALTAPLVLWLAIRPHRDVEEYEASRVRPDDVTR